MTQSRRDKYSTEFGIWIREQPEIDSRNGYVTTNIDFFWMNYTSGKWMFVEEKRYGYMPKKYQITMYKVLDRVAQQDTNYCGFHLLVFTNTNPDDGRIFLDGKYINRTELIEFLEFDQSQNWYQSWWPDPRIVRVNCDTE